MALRAKGPPALYQPIAAARPLPADTRLFATSRRMSRSRRIFNELSEPNPQKILPGGEEMVAPTGTSLQSGLRLLGRHATGATVGAIRRKKTGPWTVRRPKRPPCSLHRWCELRTISTG